MRTALPIYGLPNGSSGLTLTLTPADTTNGNNYQCTGNELLLAYNTDTVAHTVTITSSPDTKGRLRDMTNETVPAGQFLVVSPKPPLGWVQGDGTVWVTASSGFIQFAVLMVMR